MAEPNTAPDPRPLSEAAYEPPTLTHLGEVREVVLGSGSQDTADMNTARYW